jgi:hypothetical protein
MENGRNIPDMTAQRGRFHNLSSSIVSAAELLSRWFALAVVGALVMRMLWLIFLSQRDRSDILEQCGELILPILFTSFLAHHMRIVHKQGAEVPEALEKFERNLTAAQNAELDALHVDGGTEPEGARR